MERVIQNQDHLTAAINLSLVAFFLKENWHIKVFPRVHAAGNLPHSVLQYGREYKPRQKGSVL